MLKKLIVISKEDATLILKGLNLLSTCVSSELHSSNDISDDLLDKLLNDLDRIDEMSANLQKVFFKD